MLDGLRTWLETIADVPVVWANQNAPRPVMPYMTLSIITLSALGHDEHSNVDDEGMQSTTGQREVSVSLSCFEAEDEPDPRRAVTRLGELQNRSRTPGARDRLYQEGFSILGDETITEVPAVVGTKWQPRATLDFRVLFENRVRAEMDWIETVAGEAGIDDFGRIHTETYKAEVV